MKRFLAIMIALLLAACTCCACAESDEKLGLLSLMGVDGDVWTSIINTHMKEEHNSDAKTMDHAVYYDSLDALKAALDNGEVKAISTNKFIAQHLVAHDDHLVMLEQGGNSLGGFAMMTLEGSEAYAILNDAIIAMKADGALEKLAKDYIYSDNHDEKVPLPVFEGAPRIRVAVTGDLAPIDTVNADGEPVGFSCAMLAEIANRTQVNFEMILVDSTQRAEALTGGDADALFWVRTVNCLVEGCDGYSMSEEAEGAVITEIFAEDTLAALIKK